MTPRTASVRPDALVDLGVDILRRVGVPNDDARLVADSLVESDLWGHHSHGLLRLSWYVERIRGGVMTPVTRTDVVVDGGAVAVLDGNDGVGQVVTDRAAQEAVRRARAHGVGVVAVRNSNHFGTAAYFTRRVAAEGCLALLTTNGSPAMAPWGGRVKTVGANPWSIAVPAGRYGVAVVDIANTTVARGKVYAALQRGEPIPPGWAMDSAGVPTTDPAAAIEGLILPMAGHKGYAISFMMDAVSGVLTGSSFATAVAGPYQPDMRSGCGHLFLAMDVAAVADPDEFGSRMETLIEATKAVPLADGFDEIFFPGEIEDRNATQGRRQGIDLPAKTLTELKQLADSTGAVWELPMPRERD